jgi:hypothetical protein
MNTRNSLQAKLCVILTVTLALAVCVNAQPTQDAQQAQLQQALALYLASQGTNPVAAARVQALLIAAVAQGGQTASQQQAQISMALALKNAQRGPEAPQGTQPSALRASSAAADNELIRTAQVGSPFQGTPASPSRSIPIGDDQQAGLLQASSAGMASSPAKKDRMFRIGVLTPDAQLMQNPGGGAKIPESLRAMIVSELSGPLVEVIPITARIPMQVEAEVKQQACDYVLYSAFVQKQKAGAGAFFKKAGALAPMMSMIPMAGGLGGAMAGAAAGGALGAAGNLAGLVKAKDQWTLTYKLVAPGNVSPVLTSSNQATARSDGEDVVKGLIDQEAISVINQLTQKK